MPSRLQYLGGQISLGGRGLTGDKRAPALHQVPTWDQEYSGGETDAGPTGEVTMMEEERQVARKEVQERVRDEYPLGKIAMRAAVFGGL